MSPAETSDNFRRRQAIVPGLLLFLAAFGLFLPALRNGFVNYDDPDYVTANPQVQHGVSWDGIRWAFRTNHAGNWHPLTWLSHMADCQLFGLRPPGHHFTSVLLHAISAWLLFLVFRRMTGATWRSLMVAALFGLHPLHVESVAWVSERKDVLSTLFWMLTLGAYVKWAERKSGDGLYYALALVFLGLGLMSKAMLVSVPFALLILDYWPLRRFEANERLVDKLRLPDATPRQAPHLKAASVAARLVVEKIPFFAIAAADGLVTLIVQRQAGAMGDSVGIPLATRVENALISCCRYLGKLFYPEKLAVFYPYPEAWPLAQAAAAAALLLGITVFAAAVRRRHPYLLAGWIWYLATLAPVIGLVQAGSQSMADRYTYVPSIGIFVAVVWGVHALTARWRRQAIILGAVAAAVLASCTFLTHRQIAYWATSESLFRHALAVTKDNWLAHDNLGNALSKDPGRQREAIAEYEAALRIRPDSAEARNNLGIALAQTGDAADALAQYEEALRLKPNDSEAHYNLGNALRRAGRLPDAIAQYEETLRLNPDSSTAHNNLGSVLLEAGRPGEAIPEYQEALRLKPDLFEARNNLGLALAETGRLGEAAADFALAAQMHPNDAGVYINWGAALAGAGRNAEAAAPYDRALQLSEDALRLDPRNAEARANLARLSALLQGPR